MWSDVRDPIVGGGMGGALPPDNTPPPTVAAVGGVEVEDVVFGHGRGLVCGDDLSE